MSVLNDTWRFLAQRRLWPVAILLIAAAAAVPMLLSEDPPPPAAAPVVAVKADKDAVLAEEPIVTAAADGDRSGRRHVLGSRKDPFKPQATPDAGAQAEVRQGRRHRRGDDASDHRWRLEPDDGRLARAGHRHPGHPRPQEEVRALRADGPLRRERREPPAAQGRQAPAGPAVQRRAGADLPRCARRREDRGVPGRLGRRRPGRRDLPAFAHHLRDDPHPRGRDRVLRRARRQRRGRDRRLGPAVRARRGQDPQDHDDGRQAGQEGPGRASRRRAA